jgi:hypothetical protein
MIERIAKKYKLLFELRLLHHYWLDEGTKIFDSLPKEKRKTRLESYDRQSFLNIKPTDTTTELLKGLGGVYKDTALGCIVGVPISEVIPPNTIFEFSVTVKDPAFFNYTALTLRPQKIYEFSLQSEDVNSEEQPPKIKTYRYKENVPVLSNLTGATRGAGENKTLFLSKEIPVLQENDLVESLVLSGDALLQLTSDSPNADTQQLNAKATDFPVFVNQADIPAIEPPKGLNGVPEKGIMLSNDIPDNVFALIQLSANDNLDFNIIDRADNTEIKQPTHPIFHIRFKNRSTVWQYLKKKDGELVSREPEPLPLTYFGTAGKKIRPKPSEGLVKAEQSGDNDRITQLVSNIFI